MSSVQSDPQAERGWGPSVEQRGNRRRGRLLLYVLVFLLIVAVAFPLALSSRVPREPVSGLASSSDPTHVLIAGSDSREGLTEDEQRELATGFADTFTGERTDTVFLLSYSGSDVALLSFPRDLWVERCDGSTGRLNVAQSIDGPGCLVQTIRDISGIEVSHYVGVTFGGFRDVVDAVGGVNICLEDAINDVNAGIDLPAGCQDLDGADALGYVRVRKLDDDLARIGRQQQFVRALASEVASPSTLLNPVRLWGLSGEVGNAITLDDSMGATGLARLAWAMRGMGSSEVASYTVPATPRTTDGGAAVLDVDGPQAETLFASFRDGSVFDGDNNDLDPADIRVSVLNGAGVSGLAAQVSDLLGERGYDVADVGNTEDRDQSLVRYPPGQREQAERLQDDLPANSDLEESADVTIVTLLIGADAAGLE